MATITHQLGINSEPQQLTQALSELDGLASWWTQQVSGNGCADGVLQFRFNGEGFDMKVMQMDERLVKWRCIGGPDEWIDTEIIFDIQVKESGSELFFTHKGWESETPFHYHCSMKWAVFLLSLKTYLETGKGQPFPHGISIAVES
ncbi:MAG: SRPBCC domain-containing protein [Gammaproteobacteria bacterium]|nr:SRPBCC domain-containing protein [Gammaproteobacteria bacterium]